jgi:hypothetical protein
MRVRPITPETTPKPPPPLGAATLHRGPRLTGPRRHAPLPFVAARARLTPDPASDALLGLPRLALLGLPRPIPGRPRRRPARPPLPCSSSPGRYFARTPPTHARPALMPLATTRPGLRPCSPDSSIPPSCQGMVHMLIHMFYLIWFEGDPYVE